MTIEETEKAGEGLKLCTAFGAVWGTTRHRSENLFGRDGASQIFHAAGACRDFG